MNHSLIYGVAAAQDFPLLLSRFAELFALDLRGYLVNSVLRPRFLLVALLAFPAALAAQVFVTTLGGAAALTNGSATATNPVRSSNYDSRIGPAFTIVAGYHFTDWFSGQVGYFWNLNEIITTETENQNLLRRRRNSYQNVVSADLLVYVRPRSSRIRPFLSAGPAWVRIDSVNRPGLRVAVGADLLARSGWGFRYTFTETMTANSLGTELNPTIRGKLMNFRNMFGVVKVF